MARWSPELPDGSPTQRYAVVFGLYPGDPSFHTVVERDADSSGAPAGSPVVVAWLAPGVRHYIEEHNASQGFLHYRFRHAGFGYDFGEPTAWYRARPVAWNGEIPNIPREALLDLDLDLDGTDGTVDIVANGGRQVRSIAWDFATNTYPSDPSTVEDTDLEGDVTVVDAFTLSAGETGYVTVAFYSLAGGLGTLLGTLRKSIRYVVGEFTVPTIQELIDETATEGELDLVVNDPDLLVTQVRFRTKVGKAPFSDWTAESVPASIYGTWTVALDAKHLPYIEYEVTYVLGGETEIIQSAVAYDTDLVPELLSLSAHVGSVFFPTLREAQIDYIGDSDVGSIRFATSTATYPDRATTQAGSVNAGRTGTNVTVSALSASAFDLFISVLAYSEDDGTGNESTILYTTMLPGEGTTSEPVTELILNPEFDEGESLEGSFWATATSSTGEADASTTPTGVDFTADGDGQVVLLVQVTDDDDDITKPVSV
jgi:hypothetical protein